MIKALQAEIDYDVMVVDQLENLRRAVKECEGKPLSKLFKHLEKNYPTMHGYAMDDKLEIVDNRLNYPKSILLSISGYKHNIVNDQWVIDSERFIECIEISQKRYQRDIELIRDDMVHGMEKLDEYNQLVEQINQLNDSMSIVFKAKMANKFKSVRAI